MSTIGGGVGALNTAASFAGAQRTESDTDRAKEVAAERKFQVDRATARDQSLGDVADPDLSTDRDADGRLPYGPPPAPEETDATEEQGPQTLRRSGRCQDAFEERGNVLDVEV